MNEMKRTLSFAGGAAVLVLLAFATSPRRPDAESLRDQGGPFFAEFTDATKATSLEVGEYDEKRAKLNRFNVALVDGKWSIPSHHNYPADAKDRLGKVAASMVGIRKETLRSERPQDHELFGVLDPYDQNVGAAGRGRRVTLKDVNGRVLADYIFGKETKDGSGTRYVRLPDQKRTYTTKAKLDFSTKFEDWIETDLLKATQPSIRRVTIDNYSLDLEQGKIKDRATYFLAREEAAGAWKVSSAKDTEEPNSENISSMLSAITDLKIVGVRPKPAFLVTELKSSGDLRINVTKVTQQQIASLNALQQMGYYPMKMANEIQLLSNDGEVQVSCEDGIVYTMRFGDVVVGEGEALTAGTEEAPPKKKDDKKDEKKTGTEGRYLFVTTRFDDQLIPALAPEPVAPPGYNPEKKDEKKPDDKKDGEKKEEKKDDPPEVAKYKTDKADWDKKKTDREKKVTDGKKRTQELTDRFAGWYYVISGETFKRLRKDQKDLVKSKEAPKKDDKKEDEHKHDEKKEGEKKPEDPKKPDEPKKPEDKKPEEKKPEEKKPDEKKAEEPKKPEEKKPDAPKPEEKKP